MSRGGEGCLCAWFGCHPTHDAAAPDSGFTLGGLGGSWGSRGLLDPGSTGYYIESSSNKKGELEFTVCRLLITPAPARDILGANGGPPLS